MYDMTVTNGVATWRPRQPLTADEVVQYAKDALNMLERRVPDSLLDLELPALLAEKGEYKRDVDGGVKISVWRAAQP